MFKSARELSAHVKEKHKYKFLCKYRKCKSVGYASKNSADRLDRHHNSPCHICATCVTIWRPISTSMIQKNSSVVCIQIAQGDTSPKQSIIDTYKLTRTHSPHSHALCVTKNFTSKNIWMNTSRYTPVICHRSVLIATNDTSGDPVLRYT